ncbi:MAG TPA: hypothetical protein VE465_09060 [Streptosporangiaceae bacterium]|nr:hypothetical protein [Streptosporangiaceae bacterium]
MTVLLVLLCLIVGALELYAGKRSKDQADAFVKHVEELRQQVDRQSGVLVTVGEQLKAEMFKVQRDVLPAMENRVRENTGEIEQLRTLLHQADAYLRTQAQRMQDLEKQKVTLAALRRKLSDIESSMEALPRSDAAAAGQNVETALARISALERNGDQIMAFQRDLTKTLEDVEDVVTDLLGFTSAELDQAVATALTGRRAPVVAVGGRLWSRDPRLRDVLVEMYEQCVQANHLGIRFRAAEGGEDGADDGQLRYFLAGRTPEELVGDFAALLVSIGRGDAAAGGRRRTAEGLSLEGMLRAFAESTGAVAQIGPLVALRTREDLLCAVLSHAQVLDFETNRRYTDTLAAAVWLRRLPGHQVRDLTAWAAQPPEV